MGLTSAAVLIAILSIIYPLGICIILRQCEKINDSEKRFIRVQSRINELTWLYIIFFIIGIILSFFK